MKIMFSSMASSFYKTLHPSSTPLLTDLLLILHHRRLSPLHRRSRSSITPLPQYLSFSFDADEFRYLLHAVFCRCSLKLVSVVAAASTYSSRRRWFSDRYGKLSVNELPSFFSYFDLVVASPVEDYFLYIDDLKNPDKEEAEKITQPYLDALGEDYSELLFFPLQSCMNHSCSSNAKAFKRDEDRDGQAAIIAVRPIRKGKEWQSKEWHLNDTEKTIIFSNTVSLPDDVDSSDEELSDPSNLDYLERPISHYYDEDELFGCKLPKPQRSNGILKKGGVHLHKQVHLRSLNCLDDSVEFATPPSAPPIIDADFPPQLERFSKGSPMNEQNDSWPSRESVAGRSECSIEQKPSNVKATTDFAQRLDRTITEDTERPHLAYYNTSCNSQYAWQTLITYDACICLCLQAWARGCTEAPEFLKDECLALRRGSGDKRVWHPLDIHKHGEGIKRRNRGVFELEAIASPNEEKGFESDDEGEELVPPAKKFKHSLMEVESVENLRFKQTQIRLWFGISSKQDPSNRNNESVLYGNNCAMLSETGDYIKGEDINMSISHAADSIGLKEIPRYEVKIIEEDDWMKGAQRLRAIYELGWEIEPLDLSFVSGIFSFSRL
ncbi:hypothetical protein Ahy_A04g020784 isoform B [Arachis hypogaea]|uniref:SET domain-containing protein n=1 Tax=Arachis hypogaea TaxID=3818 RepID=A0A445DIU6_ARAHY|nr:hypothetical protein Ahy_A04g020784 isoform B [Arachis hypogaea]